ncbi:MAG: hypothetical protein COA42_18265 [Alteromonadaceae bacterium]|nr:MAG: hypothetical protein COA42_18265 [Alteromonadaceae bacterium]
MGDLLGKLDGIDSRSVGGLLKAGNWLSLIVGVLSIPGSTPGAGITLNQWESLTSEEALAEVRSHTGAVNLDTGTLRALGSADVGLAAMLIAAIGDQKPLVTATALAEFTTSVMKSTDRTIHLKAAAILATVSVIPDNPSARVMALTESRKVGFADKLIFGTGDQLGITTFTSDAKFVRGALVQGVRLETLVHPPHRL